MSKKQKQSQVNVLTEAEYGAFLYEKVAEKITESGSFVSDLSKDRSLAPIAHSTLSNMRKGQFSPDTAKRVTEWLGLFEEEVEVLYRIPIMIDPVGEPVIKRGRPEKK